MTDFAVPVENVGQSALEISSRVPLLFALALLFVGAGFLVPGALLAATTWFVGLTLSVLGLMIIGVATHRRYRLGLRAAMFHEVAQYDHGAMVLTDSSGRIEAQNAAARERFGLPEATDAAQMFDMIVGAPAATFARLGRSALDTGRSAETFSHLADAPGVVATRIGEDAVMWRFDPETDTAASRDVAPLFARSPGVGMAGSSVHAVGQTLPPENGPGTPAQGGEAERYLEDMPVPILRIARDGSIEQANRRARQLLEDARILGRPFSEVVEGLGRPIREWLSDAFDGRGLHRPEVVRMTPGNVDLYLQITLGQVGTGADMRLVAVLHDATELKTLEAQFVQSQKMQAIGQLAGGVAHDFNNLLTAISGHCDLLLLRRDEMDPDFADLEQINQNANRAASLVGQLLAFSRKQNLRPEFLDLRLTLADLTHLLNRLVGEKVHLQFSHDPALRHIRADKRQLEQVIMNLVVNARDAMPSGGKIAIETQVETLDEPLSRDRVTLPAGSYVTVRVRDEGTGITTDKLPKIFEPFFTTKKTGEGTGLGLSTAYGIVKQTGGFIFADSEPGRGSVFSLYFPAHQLDDQKPAATPAAASRKSVSAGDGVVLLVEDEAPVRAFASRALRLRGYTVIEAENGEEAIAILEDADLAVDIFVSDVIMPGMDGPSWVKEALIQRPDTKVVFVSGYSEENLAETQATIPNSVFLPKPFSLTQLTTTVQDQLA